jgi:hypothetical protein
VLQKRYGPGGRFNISQAEQDRFITILLNAVQSTIAFGYGSGDALNLEARLHYADTAVVALPGDNCNTGGGSAADLVGLYVNIMRPLTCFLAHYNFAYSARIRASDVYTSVVFVVIFFGKNVLVSSLMQIRVWA